MSKFNQVGVRPAVASPVRTETVASGRTFEGAPGFAREAKSELFLLAVANMVGENTFYEKAGDRDDRYEQLVHEVAVADSAWTLGFLRWLRTEANMRSVSLVGAAEAVKARIAAKAFGDNRQMVDAVLHRADEPGEMLAYWTSRHGRNVPLPVKNGVADAAVRLYNQRSLLKYDTDSHGYRFADVIELVRPKPQDSTQSALFRHAIDRRHGRDDLQQIVEHLPMVYNNVVLRSQVLEGQWERLLDPEALRAAGMTWEDALSLAGAKVDKARLWSAMIPSMGIMALARNLRNFDEAGVPDDVAAQVIARFTDPEQVAKSRMFPFRWLAAYRHAPSLRWGHALDQALTASLANVPALPGRTLVLVDQSPSMFPGYYFSTTNKSDISLADQAKVFGAAVAMRAANATLVQYGGRSEQVTVPKGVSLLKLLDQFKMIDSTDTFGAMRQWFAGHDRVIVVTDEQTRPGLDPIPANVPVYVWNVAGYRHGQGPGQPHRHVFGGLTDAAFRLVPLLEAGRNAAWPWVQG